MMAKKNQKKAEKVSPTKVDFKKHLIIVGAVIILIFIFALIYSSYEGNLAGEASRRGYKMVTGDKAASAAGDEKRKCLQDCVRGKGLTAQECNLLCG
ncbi:MAG TPA: hypothetical protein VJI15_03120 [Candidatus Nanoarchaeia archaeon]|nr:hypothetical protein [Candidatus Nanoarchaeia archaeon]